LSRDSHPDCRAAGKASTDLDSEHRSVDAERNPKNAPVRDLARRIVGSERWQGRLVGEDPFALLDLLQHIVGQRLQFEADLAHPLRHQRPVVIDVVTRVDRLSGSPSAYLATAMWARSASVGSSVQLHPEAMGELHAVPGGRTRVSLQQCRRKRCLAL